LDFYLQGYSVYCALKKDMQSLAYSIRKSLSPIFKDVRSSPQMQLFSLGLLLGTTSLRFSCELQWEKQPLE